MKTLLSIAAVVFVLFFTLIPVAPVMGQQVVTASSPSTDTFSETIRKQIPTDVPILADINITPPDSSVPAELAQLSGAWVGKYHGMRTNTHMADQVYVFEKVSPKSVTMVSAGIGRFVGSARNYGVVWSNRYELQPKETSPLTVVLPNGNEVTFLLKGDQLYARGHTWVGTFKKIQ